MTFIHVGLLLLGLVGAIGLSDLLAHRGIARWPVAVGTVVLIVVGGWLYSAPLSALALGAAIGSCVLFGYERVRDISRTRRQYREVTASRRARSRRIERAARGEDGPQPWR